MPCLTSFYRVCCPTAMMACHARHSTVCAAKGDDVMQRPMLFNCVCCPKAVMSCHARRRPTLRDAQRHRWHATPDVVRPCVLPKGDDGMPRLTLFDRRLTVFIIQGL